MRKMNKSNRKWVIIVKKKNGRSEIDEQPLKENGRSRERSLKTLGRRGKEMFSLHLVFGRKGRLGEYEFN